nr:hypothetical protein Iba_chr04aCG6120 [Ipomoea batatas]
MGTLIAFAPCTCDPLDQGFAQIHPSENYVKVFSKKTEIINCKKVLRFRNVIFINIFILFCFTNGCLDLAETEKIRSLGFLTGALTSRFDLNWRSLTRHCKKMQNHFAHGHFVILKSSSFNTFGPDVEGTGTLVTNDWNCFWDNPP